MLTDYSLNSQVSVCITGSIASGLLGQVEDGPRAIIRNREIAWDHPLPLRDYVGQTRQAVVIGFHPAYEELELSLRLCERDPWKKVAREYAPGSEVEGQVVGLTRGGAFVEIEPGVEGFLPVGELALDLVERIKEWLWIHDHVKALVTEVDAPHRRLRLSLKELLARREARIQSQLWAPYEGGFSSETTLAEALPTEVRLRLLRLDDIEEPLSIPEEPRRRYFPEETVPSPKSPPSSSVVEGPLLPLDQREDVQAILSRLYRDTQATTVMLLRLDPGRRRLLMESCTGKPFPLEQAPPDLIHSPLEDVLQKGQEVWNKVTPESSRFQRLLDLLPFQGFLGIPLPALESSCYGLILLKEQGGFGQRQCQEARLAAYLIASTLQQRRLMRALQPWQAQNLVGQLWSSIVHEVNSKLGAIQFLAEGLQEGVRDLARWPEKAEDATFLRELEQAVEKIADAQQQARGLRDRYLGLTVSDEPQLVDLKTLAEEMTCALRCEAQQHNILLIPKGPENLPPVQARPSQLRQIFLNLMLNAIQQMARAGRCGHVMVELSHLPDASRPVHVRFIDEGPGIHVQLWERIFDFGFTTKKGGAGLGLTISRQMAKSLGGTLQVEKSHILWGTTFLLELPKGA